MKATNEEIEKRKLAFSSNPDYEGKSAEELALKAALQYGRLYSPNASFREKNEFRQAWKTKIVELGNKYKTAKQSEEQFKEDIRELKESLNKEPFINILNNNSQELGYEPGFRLGHAQKSFSIYLKHLWTRGELKNIPPVCPIDGVILKLIHNYDAWTKVNSFEDKKGIIRGYNTHLRLVKEAAKQEGYSEIAEWELMKWEPNNINKDNKKSYERRKNNTNTNKKTKIKQLRQEQPTNINYQPDYEALLRRNTRYRVFNERERINGRTVYYGCELDNGLRLYVGKNQKGIFCSILGNNLTQEIKETFSTLLPKSGKDWIARYCDYNEAVETFNRVLDRLA